MKNKKILLISLFSIFVIMFTFIFLNKQTLDAYFLNKNSLISKISTGNIKASVTELNYKNNQILKPNDEIIKDPILTNTGSIDEYLRAQVYVPIAKLKYVDSNENIIFPDDEIDLISYEYNLGQGWQRVKDEGFSGMVQDKNENKYRVYTYKFIENNTEKIVKSGEEINIPVFNKIKTINYLDIENAINLKVIVKAIAVQTLDGKSADEMWTFYKNQNGSGIGGVE